MYIVDSHYSMLLYTTDHDNTKWPYLRKARGGLVNDNFRLFYLMIQ